MTDDHGFRHGFVVLFGVVPAVAGAIVGALWARRRGRRGPGPIVPAVVGVAASGLCVFAAAVPFFRA